MFSIAMDHLLLISMVVELIGFSFLTYDMFILRRLDKKTGELSDTLTQIAQNDSTIFFGTAVQLATLYGRLAVVARTRGNRDPIKLSSQERTVIEIAEKQIIDADEAMVPPEELLELQKNAKGRAETLKKLNTQIQTYRNTITRFAIVGTVLIVTASVLQIWLHISSPAA